MLGAEASLLEKFKCATDAALLRFLSDARIEAELGEPTPTYRLTRLRGPIHVQPFLHCHVIREQLPAARSREGRKQLRSFWNKKSFGLQAGELPHRPRSDGDYPSGLFFEALYIGEILSMRSTEPGRCGPGGDDYLPQAFIDQRIRACLVSPVGYPSA